MIIRAKMLHTTIYYEILHGKNVVVTNDIRTRRETAESSIHL